VTWCSLANNSATGNGTVTVNVSANPTIKTRAATITVASGTLTRQVAVTQDVLTAPPYAASGQTWVIGNLTWSDDIRMPECPLNTSWGDNDDPVCGGYTLDAKTWFFYNLPYVKTYGATVPDPVARANVW
jgi:hypothetical protein